MTVGEFQMLQNKGMINKEIESMARNICGESEKSLKISAMSIAKSYLTVNSLVNPITLARSSFYIALKEIDRHPETKIKQIINNNEKTNKWWMYLVPIIEKHLKTK